MATSVPALRDGLPRAASSTPRSALLQGLLTMAGLIVAIGAQNALVLREGALARATSVPVGAGVHASDWLLVVLGVFGLGAALAASAGLAGGLPLRRRGLPRRVRRPRRLARLARRVAPACSWPTAPARSAPRSRHGRPHLPQPARLPRHRGAARRRSARSTPARRALAFVAGAWAASAMWFVLLGFGASGAARFLRRPAAWRAIDAAVALVMGAMALQLLLRPLGAPEGPEESHMKVIVLGAGIIGISTAWYLLDAGPRRHGGRPPARRGAGDQLRQRRADLGELLRALGQRGGAAQGAEVAVRATTRRCCSVPSSTRSNGAGAWPSSASATTPPSSATCSSWWRWAATATQSLKALVGAAPASTTSGSSAASCTSSPTQKDFDAGARRRRADAPLRRGPPRAVARGGAARSSRRSAASAPHIAGGTYTPSDESGDARVFTQELARAVRRARRAVPVRPRRRAASSGAGECTPCACADRDDAAPPGAWRPTHFVVALRCLQRAAAAPRRRGRCTSIPAKGYSRHAAR